MMADSGRGPLVNPFTWVASEINARGRVADCEQWTGHNDTFRGDKCERTVAILAETQKCDGTVQYVKLHAHAIAAFAVINTKTTQQRVFRADGQMRGSVMTHFNHEPSTAGDHAHEGRREIRQAL